jgi:8-oxo-dGTP pyrophosphatase MutT (NUDIX family)
MDSAKFIFDEEFIRSKIHQCDSPKRIKLKDDFFTSSAILFTIIPYIDKSYDLVLIHRTNRGTRHRGEMSFPGGKFELNKDNSLRETALREAEEEIGVQRGKVNIIGCLDDFPTMTRYIITPFIATIDKNQEFIRDPKEVQEIIQIPIDFFINKVNFNEQVVDVNGNQFPVFYFNYIDPITQRKYTVWGATAYMISTFIELIYNISMSKLGLKRFKLEKIRDLKEYIKYRNQVTNKF